MLNLARQKPLWDLTRGYRARYGRAIAAMALATLFLFAAPLVSKTALDAIVDPGAASGQAAALFARFSAHHSATGALVAAAGLICLLTALAGLFQYLRARWAAAASEEIVRGLRDRLLDHLEHLPCAYHDRADTGDLVQRCSSDVETVRVFLVGQVVEIGRTVLLVGTVVPVMLWMDVRMALVSIALLPPIFVSALLFFRKVQRLFREADEVEGKMTGVLQENLTGIRVVRAFGRQDHERCKFGTHNDDFRDRTQRLIRVLGVFWSSSDLLCFLQVGLTLLLGARWLAAGEITVGTLFAFLSYQAIVIWPVRHLGRVLTDTGKAIVALGRIREILTVPRESDLADPAGGQGERFRGAIRVDGLTFSHEDGENVLSDLSLSIKPGQTVALLGPPGSGKSTLVQLLLRLYDYEAGSIRLDGRELRTLDRAWVRRQFGVVLQEPFLYSKTVAANVRVGHSGATADEVEDAARAACVHGAIEEFEHGYDTLLGERGVTLSGGQRQRLAIARALVKDPAVLVLDDALSAVDTETEARILDALASRRNRRTTILIAHRLSSILHADRILVLERGRVAQDGTHAELAEIPGVYRRLWRIQNDVEDEIAADLDAARRDRELEGEPR